MYLRIICDTIWHWIDRVAVPITLIAGGYFLCHFINLIKGG